MTGIARIALAIGVATLATACGDDNDGTTDPVENEDAVTVTATTSATFSPSTVSIITGGLVTWAFQSLEHNVTFAAGTGAPPNIINSSNTSTSRSFATAGIFTYQCTLHPGMTGTVRVGQ